MVPEPPLPTSGDSSPKCGPALDTTACSPVRQLPNTFSRRLTPQQRGQLLQEVKQDGQVSAKLRKEIEASLRGRSGSGVRMSDLVKNAQAMPETLGGPMQVHLPAGSVQADIGGDSPAPKKSDKKTSVPDKKTSGDKKRAPARGKRVESTQETAQLLNPEFAGTKR